MLDCYQLQDADDHGCFDDERMEDVCAILDVCDVPYLQSDDEDSSVSTDNFNASLSSIESDDEDIATQFGMHPLVETDRQHSLSPHQPFEQCMNESLSCDPAKSFGFNRFIPPPHIIRNSPPWMGKDDDIQKIKEICTEVSRMTDSADTFSIWGFDQKIAGCHIKLERTDPSFKRQVREVPVLHLTKQKIVNVSSAYKKAGFMEIIRFMMDNDKIEDITKLISADNIRNATRIIRRVALSFNLALQVAFVQDLSDEDRAGILEDIDEMSPSTLSEKWEEHFLQHVRKRSEEDATYAMHVDMMRHCFEAVSISFAERIGGADGYSLLRASMKMSLPFAFTNGASQYAAFSTRLLIDHSSAPPVVQGIKKEFFAIPYGLSGVNYGLDTIREEDHKKCKKFYRPGASASALSNKINRMNEASDVVEQRKKSISYPSKGEVLQDHDNWSISDNDVKFILKTAAMIFRRGALTQNDASVPFNVYAPKEPVPLSPAVLDREASNCGEYLLTKYCQQEGLFSMTSADIESLRSSITGPKPLVDKVLKGTSQTVNRNCCQPAKQKPQEQSQQIGKQLVKDKKKMDSLYSRYNTCQAFVKPDGTKYAVAKSLHIPKALICIVGSCIKYPDSVYQAEKAIKQANSVAIAEMAKHLSDEGLIKRKLRHIPSSIANAVTVVTTENAGVPYKTTANTADDYIRQSEEICIKSTLSQLPNVRVLQISEEKYSFTPDVFKAATRTQRDKSIGTSINHLKMRNEMINETTFAKAAITSTVEGKKLISTFLAKNMNRLSVKQPIKIIFDSELIMNCTCKKAICTCTSFTTPVECDFDENGFVGSTKMDGIKQRKGEAEMAVIDWLYTLAVDIEDNDVIMSVITSGDIDAVVIHLFTLSVFWPKYPDGKYRNPVYVKLLKPGGHFDLYNITGILEAIQGTFKEQNIGTTVAMSMCLGGNDFLPRFKGITHQKMIQNIFGNSEVRKELFMYNTSESPSKCEICSEVYLQLLKCLFCPKGLNPEALSYDDVRQMSIKPAINRRMESTLSFTFSSQQVNVRDPSLWLPPSSCVLKLVPLIDCMALYLFTAGQHEANLPDFTQSCLIQDGQALDLGKDSHCETLDALITVSKDDLIIKKKQAARSKRQLELTPKKTRTKRKAVFSTPKKIQ